MRHHQISQGIEDEAMMHVHCSSQEYDQGNTKILSNGHIPTKGQAHQAITAGLPYTKSSLLPLPQTDANGRSYLRGGSQGSGAVFKVRHFPIHHGSASMDPVVLFTIKSSLLTHQFFTVSPMSGNSKLVSGSKESP
jgi:hypothetical protein